LDPLGPEEGERILRRINTVAADVLITIDIKDVGWIEDHVIVQLANTLVLRQGFGSFVGLRQHHARLLRYLGIPLGPPAHDVP